MTEWEGVFPLWKEAGMTSHDCVSKARRLFHMKRIGHTGTLDPDVSGVLPLCLGRATRIVEYLQELPKTYEAEMTLGYSTDTEDASGKVIERTDEVHVTEIEVREAVNAFIGEIEQIPPMYSAVRWNGKRLYELAREGVTVERKARKATIYQMEIISMELDRPHPIIQMRVTCSKGTYIRTLCADIGRSLGVPAVMSGLVRTGSGPVTQEDCITFAEAERLLSEGKLGERLISISDALSFLPAGHVAEHAVRYATKGQKLDAASVHLADAGANKTESRLYRLHGGGGLLGVYRFDDRLKKFVPVKLFI